MLISSPGQVRRDSARLGRLALVCVLSVTLGVLTAYAQQWLPDEIRSLANSSGSWALAAFLLGLLARRSWSAAVFGCLALLGLLCGYILGAGVRGYASSTGLIVFWGAAALVAGPLLGLGASWARNTHTWRAAAGIGAMSGVLVGEGLYGLGYVAETTYPPYWWGEIAAGLAVLVAGAWSRLRDVRRIVLAIGVTAVAATAFVGVSSQNLIGLL